MRIILILFATVLQCHAATYYVATNGNNAADGSIGTPWLTIGKAVSVAAAGDTVLIGQGVYREWNTNSASGSAGNPITFAGTRGVGGSWLTEIDPSTQFTSGWVAAPEIGSGVWKQTGMSFQTRELYIDNKRVAGVADMGDLSSYFSSAHIPQYSTGAELLVAPSAALATNAVGTVYNLWDSLEALWGSTSDTLYLRLRDGTSPDGLVVGASPNYTSFTTFVYRPAINLNGKSYVTYSNLWVRGAFCGIYLNGADCSNNIVVSNKFTGCSIRVYAQSGPHDNQIIRNSFTDNFYGRAAGGGAWGGTGTNHTENSWLYNIAKYILGESSNLSDDVKLYVTGSNNLVAWNYCRGGIANSINLSSTVGMLRSARRFAPTTFRDIQARAC